MKILFVIYLSLIGICLGDISEKWMITSKFLNSSDDRRDLLLEVEFHNLNQKKTQKLDVIHGRPSIKIEIMGGLYGAIFALTDRKKIHEGRSAPLNQKIDVNVGGSTKFVYRLGDFSNLEGEDRFDYILLRSGNAGSCRMRIVYEDKECMSDMNFDVIFSNNFLYPERSDGKGSKTKNILYDWHVICRWKDGFVSAEERLLQVSFRNTDPDRYKLLNLHLGRPSIILDIMGLQYGAPFESNEISEEAAGGAFAPENYSKILIAPNAVATFEYKLADFTNGAGEERLDGDLLFGKTGKRLRVNYSLREGFIFSNTIYYK